MTTTPPPLIPLEGSDKPALAEASLLGAVAPEAQFQVTILVRRRAAAEPSLRAHLAQDPPAQAHLTRAEFAVRFGADPHDLALVAAYARASDLAVLDTRPAERRVVLSGTAAAFDKAFGVRLQAYTRAANSHGTDATQTLRCRSGAVHIPASLEGIIEGVFGLDNRPQARPHFRLSPAPGNGPGRLAHAAPVSYTPPQLAAAYAFPDAGQGQGQCIAIIELGGGFRRAELIACFKRLGLNPPTIKSRNIDGARNRPGRSADSADGEVMLDIEVAGAIAPQARIVVYFAPNTDAGFLNAVATAVHDRVNRPSVLSISWGGPESSWTAQALHAMDGAFQDAAALGVTVCCAAGDDGSSDQRAPATDDGRLHADFPASSPFALACGGTRLQNGSNGTWQESVWNQGRAGGATGGGISEVFARPSWQDGAGVPPSANPGSHVGRGVPDVAANADPGTGYQIQVDGQQIVIGGTSAVAPLYAALVALCNEQLGRRLGYLNPQLYALPAGSGVFRDIAGGNNDISGGPGPYSADAGWDACTGLGSVHGQRLLAALKPA